MAQEALKYTAFSIPVRNRGKTNRTETRTTPSGRKQWLWELEMSIPDGEIIFWATGFQLKILGPPVLSDVQYLRR